MDRVYLWRVYWRVKPSAQRALYNIPTANDVRKAISGSSYVVDPRYFGRLNLASKCLAKAILSASASDVAELRGVMTFQICHRWIPIWITETHI